MNLYKRGQRWWLRFSDHQGVQRRLRATTDRRTSDALARQINLLIDKIRAGTDLDMELAEWLTHKLDPERRELLTRWGLVSDRLLQAGESLANQIEAWREFLKNKGRPEKYLALRHDRAHGLLVVACGFTLFRDITPEAVQEAIGEWKRAGAKSDYTIAHYLGAAKAFCRWMNGSRRVNYDPLRILSVTRGRPRRQRRALTEAEQVALVTGTATLGPRWGIAATDRAMLYRVALLTGLRAGALRRLAVADIDLKARVIHARGSGADNKHSSAKPIAKSLIEPLREFIAGRAGDERLLTMPGEHHVARMLQDDARALGIDTRGVDFHALRHTFGTTMARKGVHPKTLMSLMDHHSIQLTMSLYTHSFPEDEASAVDRLPEMTKPENKQRKEMA